MKLASSILYYVHDPMCSWCWGFRETWQLVLQQLPKKVHTYYLLGGLAQDSDEPMPKEMQIKYSRYMANYSERDYRH